MHGKLQHILLAYLVVQVGISTASEDVTVEKLEEAITNSNEVNLEDLVRNLVCGCYENDGEKQVEVPSGEIDPLNPKPKVTDCYDILQLGQTSSGMYDIHPFNQDTPIRVWCDMDTDGGGWTVFQRREDGSVDFYKDWVDYKNGFGRVSAEFWLGNDHISKITTQDNYELRIDLADFEGEQRVAQYDHFRVGDDSTNYKLLLGSYSGNAGDALQYQRNAAFSTKDADNDIIPSLNCAIDRKGGFWFRSCGQANLNGEYLGGVIPDDQPEYQGIRWREWKGDRYSLKSTEMKIRPYRVNK